MSSNKTRKTQPCPSCGGTMKLKTKADRLQCKGHSRSIRTRGWWCDSCDEGILDSQALKANERQFMELRAEVEGLLRPQEIAAIREELQLSQRQVGEILGGGPPGVPEV
ncbi:MAG: type II toxin-antitoxin system MqsA family antitoxin [Proteobacteria bacterium]|nr:type II toxin-antitoxin system MqsA family antitoxin [Pseudomonadota bacterium]